MSSRVILFLTLTTATPQRIPKDWEVNICDINIKNIQGRDKEIPLCLLAIVLTWLDLQILIMSILPCPALQTRSVFLSSTASSIATPSR